MNIVDFNFFNPSLQGSSMQAAVNAAQNAATTTGSNLFGSTALPLPSVVSTVTSAIAPPAPISIIMPVSSVAATTTAITAPPVATTTTSAKPDTNSVPASANPNYLTVNMAMPVSQQMSHGSMTPRDIVASVPPAPISTSERPSVNPLHQVLKNTYAYLFYE